MTFLIGMVRTKFDICSGSAGSSAVASSVERSDMRSNSSSDKSQTRAPGQQIRRTSLFSESEGILLRPLSSLTHRSHRNFHGHNPMSQSGNLRDEVFSTACQCHVTFKNSL